MKNISLLAAAITLATATSAFAGPIEGRWNCVEKLNKNGLKGTVNSTIDFSPDGKMNATFNMDMRKVVVKIDAIAKYNATYKVTNNQLIENALGIKITKFDVAGIDMRDGDLAADLAADLMRKDGTPPTVAISGNKMQLQQPGRLISCTR